MLTVFANRVTRIIFGPRRNEVTHIVYSLHSILLGRSNGGDDKCLENFGLEA